MKSFLVVASLLAFSIGSQAEALANQNPYAEQGGLYDNCITLRSDYGLYNGCNIPLTVATCQDATMQCGTFTILANSDENADGSGHMSLNRGIRYRMYPCKRDWTAVDANNVPITRNPQRSLQGIPYRCVVFTA